MSKMPDVTFSLPWTKLLLSSCTKPYLSLTVRKPCRSLQSLTVLVMLLY